MTRLILFLGIVLAGSIHFAPPLRGADPDSQPRMRNALAHLEAAKTAKDPLTSLKAARSALRNAKKNKEGQRKDAIGYVDEAIAFATTGDKKAMLEKINKAIANVKSGIVRAN